MAAGAVRGKTSMTLREIGPGQTEMEMETDVNILGKIGEFGQPIIRKKADTMLKEFIENIKKQLASG
jgi:carbon monoxide dehydrogenase subunit G